MNDFERRICAILSSSIVQGEDLYSCLSEWNEDLENFVQTTVQHERQGIQSSDLVSDEANILIDHDSVFQSFLSLRTILLDVTFGNSIQQSRDDSVVSDQSNLDSNLVLDRLAVDWRNDSKSTAAKIEWHDMCVILRTSKNVWRWYIQLYLPLRREYPVEIQERITRQDIETGWRSKRFLELLLNLLEGLPTTTTKESQHVDSFLRHGPHYATILFFYVTYPLSSNDLNLMDVYHYMLTECNLMQRFLTILMRRNTNMQLRLSIIRNVHNALVSFPQQSTKAVTAVTVETSTKSETEKYAEWIKADEVVLGVVTYKTLLRDLLFHILTSIDKSSDEALSLPESDDDKSTNINGELIVEILRCCYALRIGYDSDTDNRWQVVIEKIFRLDAAINVHFYESKLAITCILMESSPFRMYLSPDSLKSLLLVLEQQVTSVLREKHIDDRAAAALNPILAVLYKSCMESADSFTETIRRKVFLDDDASLCDAVENDEVDDAPRNMSPIDAPVGTLRWKLIQLLTWPNSFVKRLTGELLFLLCHNNQQEFIRRVGIGNAVAILSLKGLIDLPVAVHS